MKDFQNRFLINFLTGVIFIFFTHSALAQDTLIHADANWKYYDLEDEPTGNWTSLTYDDSGWATGNAELGYGNSNQTTNINENTLTAYFRKKITVTNPAPFMSVLLQLIRDDGAVVYVNGTEVWREEMPSGTIDYNTFASSSASGSEETTWYEQEVSNNLVAGDNIIAVEVHQRSSGSSDLGFNLRVMGMPITLQRGPYLQMGTPSSMTVRWRTNGDTESVVRYGTSLSNLNMIAQNLTTKSEHEIQITGLASSTQYFYQIENSDDTLVSKASDIYFKTSPPAGNSVPTNIWVLGDCGTGTWRAQAVRDAFYNHNGNAHVDMMLFLGDNAYPDGYDDEYQDAVFENMYEEQLKNTVAWSTLGNHDGHAANGASQTGPYFDIFNFPKNAEAGGIASGTESYYSFDYGNIHFIVLNSYDEDRDVGQPMYLWAQNDIQNTTADWIIAFWHHPPYSKGSHNSDNCSGCSDMRENFLSMLESNGVDLVMSGHSHSYERSYMINGHYGESNTFDPAVHIVQPTGGGNGQVNGDGAYEKDANGTDGAVYVVAGSSGKRTDPPEDLDHPAHHFAISELGSLVIEVDDQEMHLKFLRETGVVDDSFTMLKITALPVEFLSFRARAEEERIRLSWETASESMNKGFEIYKSGDGERWQKIGWIDGKGNTTDPSYYHFMDQAPLQGMNYYRLKQEDWDGSFDYSTIVQVEYSSDQGIYFYPNPASEKVFLGATGAQAIDEVRVFDLSGKILLQTSKIGASLDVSEWENGIYFFEIKINERIFRERLAISH